MVLLYEAIRRYLLNAIEQGQFGPGDRLPSESDLARQFNVSRITSKRALQILERDGVVTRFRGRGTFVAGPVANDGNAMPSAPDDPGRAPRQRPPQIGFIVPDIDDVYGAEMLRAIDERTTELGYQLVLRRTVGNAARETEAIIEFAASGVAGLVIFPIHGEYYNREILRLVLDHFPIVLVDRSLKGIAVSSVATDNYQAGLTLTSALLDHGHREIGFVSASPERTSSIHDRYQGYLAAFRRRGREPRLDHALLRLSSTLPGIARDPAGHTDRDLISAFLRQQSSITAFVACEYPLALLIDEAIAFRGNGDMPEPVEIACFDSPPERSSRHRFLHIQQRQRDIGRTTIDLLHDQIVAGSAARDVKIAFDLIDPADELSTQMI